MLTQLLATKLQVPRTRAALVTRPRLLERLRAGADCPLVIGTRADPLLPIARLRARGQLNEVRQAELCFTPLEAAALLRQITGRDLTEGHLAALFERTEGWAAGLQMAGASLRGQDAGRIGAFIQAFSGTHRHVLDYLVEEVLRRQPRELQEFLLHTSFLQRLTGPLCEVRTPQRRPAAGRLAPNWIAECNPGRREKRRPDT